MKRLLLLGVNPTVRWVLLLPIAAVLFSCAPAPQSSVKGLPPQSVSARVEAILNDPTLTPEQKRELIVNLFAQKRKEWSGFSVYEKEKALKTAELLRSPSAPLRTPPKVMRVLILPWVDKDGVFHEAHYAFVEVEDGRWILGSLR